jgi:hypothetical protein
MKRIMNCLSNSNLSKKKKKRMSSRKNKKRNLEKSVDEKVVYALIEFI